MEIDTPPYSTAEREAWNDFVAGSNNGTIFHRLDFLDYHPDDRFDEHHLQFYYKGQNLMGVMPLAFERQGQKKVAKSPYGGSYGGIVVEEDVKFRYVERMVQSTLEYLEEQGVDELVVCPRPREQHRTASSYLEFHLSNHGFQVEDRQVTHVLDLSRFESDPFDIYEGRCRTAVRKARDEGVEVERNSEEWQEFYDLLLETYDRHGKEPTHSLDELRRLKQRFPDSIVLSVARYDGEIIAGQVGFVLDARTYMHFYNCRSEDHKRLNGVNLLIDREIRWAKRQGHEYFDLGTSVEGFEWNPGLVKFKESFGTTGHFRNVYRTAI